MSTNEMPVEFEGRVSKEKDWKEIVAWVGDLAPLPHVAAQALGLIEDPDVSAGKLTDLLGGDPALAARVLKISNSAMFARRREIATLNRAIMTIGFKTLKGIIVAATLRQLYREFNKTKQMIWENSTCSAVACNQIAMQLKKPFADEAFLLGLLHDLGKMVLLRQIPDEYQKVINQTKKGQDYISVETEMLGFANPLIGALVAKKWNFSMDTCQIILHHRDPLPNEIEDETKEKTIVVRLGDLLAHSLGYGHCEGYPDVSEDIEATAKLLDLGEEAIAELSESVQASYEEMGGLF